MEIPSTCSNRTDEIVSLAAICPNRVVVANDARRSTAHEWFDGIQLAGRGMRLPCLGPT